MIGLRRSPTFALAVVLALAAPALADPATDARARFEAGVRLFRDSRYAEARQAFEEAHRILPNGRVLANIAACLSGEGRIAEAVGMYRRFLTEGAEGLPGRARDEARREIARLRPSIGDVAVAVEPAGAEVWIDGRSVGAAPLAWPVAVSPGQSTLEVRAPGYAPFARTIEVERGASISLSVVLQTVPAPPPEGSEPDPAGSTVVVEPPPTPVPPPVPEAARLSSAPSRPQAPPPSTPIGRGPLLWTGIGLTAAVSIAATVTGLLTLSQRAEYEDETTSVARRRELYDTTPTLATLTDVFIDTAVVAALATALLFVVGGPGDDEGASPARAPALSVGGAPCCRLVGSF